MLSDCKFERAKVVFITRLSDALKPEGDFFHLSGRKKYRIFVRQTKA
jgi:hypothetical protein